MITMPLFCHFLKTTFTKMLPNKLKHINYKQLEQNSFLKDVENLSATISYTEWEKPFVNTLF